MYQFSKIKQCLICNEPVNQSTDLFSLLYQPPICNKCMKKFSIIDLHTTFLSYPLTILYNYNDFFKQVLFQYKGQGDYALKDSFIHLTDSLPYRNKLLVIVPSSNSDNAKRGFNPNFSILEKISDNIFTGLYKTSDYKQTSQKDRRLVKNNISIKNGHLLTNQKVIIFDDVITSGNTIKTCLNLVKEYHPKSIEIFILASKHKDFKML